ncbi:hypothetical protein CYLTODRAFT_414999 [Cylindrobasidium torrendii FP15055 ss-10]|uniref:Uncharacterized protein n=1 Tax=Cylindrobasidium torrendii FP15055 ss-10 TaxID=1314674 RepID=A0A0D7AXR3_9AGAR|nr:hypothetical protein CYLTODRAFT_414999 [Cylindrobasidium torrendii FP15055 ss-10]
MSFFARQSFRAASRISGPSTALRIRAVQQSSRIPQRQISTTPSRSLSAPPPPSIPSFASTVGRKPGLIPFLLFKKDGNPRNKLKGAFAVGSIALLGGVFSTLADWIEEQESQAILAWNLVQAYRIDLHFSHVDFEKFRDAAEYYRDLVYVLLVNEHNLTQTEVEDIFEAIIHDAEGHQGAEKEALFGLFVSTSAEMRKTLEICDEIGLGPVETALRVVKLLNKSLHDLEEIVKDENLSRVALMLNEEALGRFEEFDVVR